MDKAHFFAELADALGPLEKRLWSEPGLPRLSLILGGLPRSGTTLFSQTVVRNTSIAAIDGIGARFWNSPLVAIKLSEFTRRQESEKRPYISDLGESPFYKDPHEFGNFWQRFVWPEFGEEADENLLIKEDPQSISQHLKAISSAAGKSMFYKPMEKMFRVFDEESKNDPNLLFVFLDRDVERVISSMKRAFRIALDRKQNWWGSHIPESLRKKIGPNNIDELVANQIAWLRSSYLNFFSTIPQAHKIVIRYEDLVRDPHAALEKVCAHCANLGFVERVTQPRAIELGTEQIVDQNVNPVPGYFMERGLSSRWTFGTEKI